METLTTRLNSMAAIAREYCALVEQFDGGDPDGWLVRLNGLLPGLQRSAGALDAVDGVSRYEPAPDYEARFALFTRLYHGLGERDGYEEAFDMGAEGQRLSGSLADDITEIYFDLKRGLQLLDRNPAQPQLAAHDWRASFELHWQHHLSDVMRCLSRDAQGHASR